VTVQETFHVDIAADRDELEALMKALNIDQSRTRKASAWLAEKFTELKLRFDDSKAGNPCRYAMRTRQYHPVIWWRARLATKRRAGRINRSKTGYDAR